MIGFRIGKHGVTGEDLFEVLHDGQVCAVLYPEHPDGVRIMSAHFRETPGNMPRVELRPNGIPALVLRFDTPFRIVDDKIVKD